MPSGAASRVAVPGPPPIVAVILPDATEMTDTEPVSPFPTHTCEPSGVAAIDIGSLPTLIVPVTLPVAAESTETESGARARVVAVREEKFGSCVQYTGTTSPDPVTLSRPPNERELTHAPYADRQRLHDPGRHRDQGRPAQRRHRRARRPRQDHAGRRDAVAVRRVPRERQRGRAGARLR